MDNKGKGVAIILAIFLILIMFKGCATNFNDTTYNVTVTDKTNINRGNSGYYLIYCEDEDGNYYEFKNSDTMWRGKFDSSRFYNEIKVGKQYEFTVVGVRIPLFSWYQNIISFKELK